MNRWLIVIFASLAGLIGFANPVQAAAPERVLLVYDSENIQADGQYQIDSLSRILASLHIVVQRENMSAYRSGTLTDQRFSGVITMVNWHQSRLTNAQFLRDRTAFTGKKTAHWPKSDGSGTGGFGGGTNTDPPTIHLTGYGQRGTPVTAVHE